MTTEQSVHFSLSEVWALIDLYQESLGSTTEQWSILAAHSMQRLAESVDLHLSCKTDRPGTPSTESNRFSDAYCDVVSSRETTPL